MQNFHRMPFNHLIVEALERLLDRAKQGRMSFFAYALCEGPSGSEDGYLGDTNNFTSGYYALQHCAKRIMDSLDRLSPKENLEAAGNLYRYDMSAFPINHDFIAWLVNVQMLQRKEGIAGPTKVCFVWTKAERVYGGVDELYRREFFNSVMAPACKLFDIEISPEAKEGRQVTRFTYGSIVDLVKEGQSVPRIQVPEALMEDMRRNLNGIEPVTITLREVQHKQWSHRNSSMTDWIKFAEYLQARGEHVIFLRDYTHADEEITGFETAPEASRDFLIRAALYENAKCNCFVSNGPASLSLFGSRPWLQFIHCDEGEYYLMNTPEWWWINHGITKGEQFPWSTPNQRIVWQADTYEAMVRAWEETFPIPVAEAAE